MVQDSPATFVNSIIHFTLADRSEAIMHFSYNDQAVDRLLLNLRNPTPFQVSPMRFRSYLRTLDVLLQTQIHPCP